MNTHLQQADQNLTRLFLDKNFDESEDVAFPGGLLPIFVYGRVRMEGEIQTQKHGFPENFPPKNIEILHISYPQIWVKIVFWS